MRVTKIKVEALRHFFLTQYANAVTELHYRNDYELLVAIMLSAQCTDKRVNMITPALFDAYPSIEMLANASLDEVKDLIKTCSFFNNKAQNLVKMAQAVVNEHEGKIPHDTSLLVKLAGVGIKTANVFMIEREGKNLMAVDTHVFRVSHRLGLSSAKTPEKTGEELSHLFKKDLAILHQAFVLFGRYHCKAVKPLCNECSIRQWCLDEPLSPTKRLQKKSTHQ